MKLVDLDRLKWPNIVIFDMNLHGECVPMVRLSDLQALAPLEDVVPVVHGRWVYHDDDMMPWVSCSECGVCTDSTKKTPYCPNCGAKMEDKQNK